MASGDGLLLRQNGFFDWELNAEDIGDIGEEGLGDGVAAGGDIDGIVDGMIVDNDDNENGNNDGNNDGMNGDNED